MLLSSHCEIWCRNVNTDKEGYNQTTSREDEISAQHRKRDNRERIQNETITDSVRVEA